MTASLRLTVDPIACDGHGLCAELLPGLITLDDWGFPLISSQNVPAAQRGDVSAAVQLCPRLALQLDTSEQHRVSVFSLSRQRGKRLAAGSDARSRRAVTNTRRSRT